MKDNNKLSIEYSERISPIEKYNKYGIFPIKMVIHILAIFGAFQVIIIICKLTTFSRAQEYVFLNNFISNDDKEGGDVNRNKFIYSISDLASNIKTSLENYDNLNSNSIEKVEISKEDPLIEFTFYSGNFKNSRFYNRRDPKIKSYHSHEKKGKIKEYLFPISSRDIGIFKSSNEEIREFLQDVMNFKIIFNIRVIAHNFYDYYDECLDWTVNQIYYFEQRSNINLSLLTKRSSCKDYDHNTGYIVKLLYKLYWVHLLILILAIISFIHCVTYISKIAHIYLHNKKEFEVKNKQEMKSFSRSEDSEYFNPLLTNLENEENKNLIPNFSIDEDDDKVNFIHKTSINSNVRIRSSFGNEDDDNVKPKKNRKNEKDHNLNLGWTLICLIGNIFQILGSFIYFIESSNDQTINELMIGLGALCAVMNLGRYLEYSVDYGSIYNTVTYSMPTVIRYLLGVMPIFIGYILLGLCLFWKSDFFSSPSMSFITLFSLSQGDSTLDIFKDLGSISYFLGYLYTFTFCMFFFVIVMNIFIAIIEDAFTVDKMKNKTHWIYDYIEMARPKNIKKVGQDLANEDKVIRSFAHFQKLKEYVAELKVFMKSNKNNLSIENMIYLENEIKVIEEKIAFIEREEI